MRENANEKSNWKFISSEGEENFRSKKINAYAFNTTVLLNHVIVT